MGIFSTFLILGLTILTVAMLLVNANTPQLMIDNNYQSDPNFQYQLITGDSLKYAVCFGNPLSLVGSARVADLRFFTETKNGGRKYYTPKQLNSTDLAFYEADANLLPLSLDYCFSIPPTIVVMMAKNGGNYGYFGFRV
jgi:hypothetical protein